MDVNSIVALYKQNSLLTFPPEKIILWILDETLKATWKGKKAMVAKDIAEQNKQLQIAQQLILEIMPLINGAADQGRQLMLIFDYMNHGLIKANIKSDMVILEEIEQLLLELREKWKEYIGIRGQSPAQLKV